MPVSTMNSPTALPRTGFGMSSFGGGYGSGSNSFSPIVKRSSRPPCRRPSASGATEPAVREDESDGERPGEQNWRHGCCLGVDAHAAPTSCSAAIWREARALRATGSMRCGSAGAAGRSGADDRRGQDRERQERIDARGIHSPPRGVTSRTCKRPTVRDAVRRERQDTSEDPKSAHHGIIASAHQTAIGAGTGIRFLAGAESSPVVAPMCVRPAAP